MNIHLESQTTHLIDETIESWVKMIKVMNISTTSRDSILKFCICTVLFVCFLNLRVFLFVFVCLFFLLKKNEHNCESKIKNEPFKLLTKKIEE